MSTKHYDVIIIGSGASGMTLALKLSKNLKIALLAKSGFEESSTQLAQGGISAVLEPEDSIQSHIDDTINSGVGLCNPKIVEHTASQGKEMIQWLNELGLPFTKDPDGMNSSGFHLTREGGHSQRRVVHAADATGKALQQTLKAHVLEQKNISIFSSHIAIDLITNNKEPCKGVYAYNRGTKHVDTFSAAATVLATGGASKVYLYTSNPDGSTGDGIAMAWRAGCQIANMEFIQFHPTCLYHPEAGSSLISEAVRGEGGLLKRPNGERFMDDFDERAELAPRDIVARAIDHEMKRLGSDCMYLDISHKSKAFIKSHFPNIYQKCLSFDIDITKQAIPVVPAAHYTCGGVKTNQDGLTDIQSLYAIGEVAYSGLHGANRMASNSLLECLVFAHNAAKHINKNINKIKINKNNKIKAWDESKVTDSDEEVVVAHNWNELRHFMWDYVGIVRTDKRLQRALNRVQLLKHEINEYYGNFRVTPDLIELRNLTDVAFLIIKSAQHRKESRGLHYTLDYPETLDSPTPTIIEPPSKIKLPYSKVTYI
ncbi:MAG: L-aspartate oxidase [Gammaproteobacteria bacterium]|nr:L-aspartate oxidase [Gammaproteobacteria bacterium]